MPGESKRIRLRLDKYSSVSVALGCHLLLSCVRPSESFSWRTANPLRVSAQGGASITVTGSFNASAAYACKFDSTDLNAAGQKYSAIARPSADSTIVCIAPMWTSGAQTVRLSVFLSVGATGAEAADVRDLVPGPGATADRIQYAAAWQARSLIQDSAKGGKPINIDGWGFDINDADYVCKFVCIHSSCDLLSAPRFAQSEVPEKPISDTRLTCVAPMWPFSAFSEGPAFSLINAGTTKLVLEKGGVEVQYVGANTASQHFDFFDEVLSADADGGLATSSSTLIKITGVGFDVEASDYSCIFSYTDKLPYVYAASPGSAVTSKQLQCHRSASVDDDD